MKRFQMKATLALFFLAIATLAPAAPALVGHSQFAGQTLDAEAVKAVLLGKRVAIGDTRVVIVIAKASDTQEAYLKQHVGMTGSQFQNHWRRLFMTGGGSAPKVVDTEAAALKLAAETPGAIAIADSANAGSLAVLAHD
jgi:hypothetical protein